MLKLEKERLLKAVELAQAPGACSYRAGCVVAQYADLEGWDRERWPDKESVLGLLQHKLLPMMPAGDVMLLGDLQDIWDSKNVEVQNKKLLMTERVEEYFRE